MVEDMLGVLAGDTRPVVPNPNHEMGIVLTQGNFDMAIRESHRVINQVGHDMFDRRSV